MRFHIIFFYIVDILQRISEMEGRLISEIKCIQPAIHPQPNFGYDPDVEECLSLLSSNVHPSGSSVIEPSTCNYYQEIPSSSQVPFQHPIQDSQPQLPDVQQQIQVYNMSPPPTAWQIQLPETPKPQKIQNLLCKQRYQDITKAGELAVRLAVIMFGTEVMKISGLGDNQGKLVPLNEEKMREIEDIVKRMYRGKGNTDKIWKGKCRNAIAKKCERLRNQGPN